MPKNAVSKKYEQLDSQDASSYQRLQRALATDTAEVDPETGGMCKKPEYYAFYPSAQQKNQSTLQRAIDFVPPTGRLAPKEEPANTSSISLASSEGHLKYAMGPIELNTIIKESEIIFEMNINLQSLKKQKNLKNQITNSPLSLVGVGRARLIFANKDTSSSINDKFTWVKGAFRNGFKTEIKGIADINPKIICSYVLVLLDIEKITLVEKTQVPSEFQIDLDYKRLEAELGVENQNGDQLGSDTQIKASAKMAVAKIEFNKDIKEEFLAHLLANIRDKQLKNILSEIAEQLVIRISLVLEARFDLEFKANLVSLIQTGRQLSEIFKAQAEMFETAENLSDELDSLRKTIDTELKELENIKEEIKKNKKMQQLEKHQNFKKKTDVLKNLQEKKASLKLQRNALQDGLLKNKQALIETEAKAAEVVAKLERSTLGKKFALQMNKQIFINLPKYKTAIKVVMQRLVPKLATRTLAKVSAATATGAALLSTGPLGVMIDAGLALWTAYDIAMLAKQFWAADEVQLVIDYLLNDKESNNIEKDEEQEKLLGQLCTDDEADQAEVNQSTAVPETSPDPQANVCPPQSEVNVSDATQNQNNSVTP